MKPLQTSTSSRLVVLSSTLNFWQQHSFFGTGLGTFYYISSYFVPDIYRGNAIWKNAHNDHLEALLETGLVGFGLLFLMAFLCMRQGIIHFRRHQDMFWKIMTLQALISLGLFAIVELAGYHTRVPINAMILIMQISILFVPPSKDDKIDPAGKCSLSGRIKTALFLLPACSGILFLSLFTYNERLYTAFLGARSVEVLEEGVKKFPESSRLWSYLGEEYRSRAGSLQESQCALLMQGALSALENATRITPSFPFYWQQLAMLQIQAGQYDLAKGSMEKARYWAPSSSRFKRTMEMIYQGYNKENVPESQMKSLRLKN